MNNHKSIIYRDNKPIHYVVDFCECEDRKICAKCKDYNNCDCIPSVKIDWQHTAVYLSFLLIIILAILLWLKNEK